MILNTLCSYTCLDNLICDVHHLVIPSLEVPKFAVDSQHEVMEVSPQDFELRRRGIDEKVHQHGLATAHAAVHIQTLSKGVRLALNAL